MSARLLHGLLLGTLVVLVSAFLELASLHAAWPYHRERGLVLTWLPTSLLVGALLGLGGALVLPLLDRRQLRDRQAGLSLLAPILGGWLGLTGLLSGRFASWGGSAVQILAALAWAALIALLVLRLARSRVGWTMSGFVTPWFCMVGTLGLAALALVQAWRGPLPAADSPQATSAPPDGTPNIVLVVLDTVAARHLGSYGYHRRTSPALDQLATEGVVFERAYAAAPWTLPSHASLFTGLHPQTHRAGWTHPRLDDGKARIGKAFRYDHHTLAEELGRRGFLTCGVSEKSWLTDRHGLTQGFQYYFDYSIDRPSERLVLPRTRERLARRGFGARLFDGGEVDQGGRRVVDTALHWMEQHADGDRPFFLFLNLNEAHAPYLPPQGAEDFGRFLPPGAVLDDLPEEYFGHAPDRKALNSGARPRMDAEDEIQRALYDASILYQDGLLEDLFNGLRDGGHMEDTLVLITSDHGEEFGEQGRFGHQLSLSDRLLHVPLIARYPSLLPAGMRIADEVSLVDVFPTILGVLHEIAPPEEPVEPSAELRALEGFNLLPRMRGESVSPRDWVLAHADHPTGYLAGFPNFSLDETFPLAQTGMFEITMLRHGSEKYFRFSDGAEVWLDLELDPHEDAAERAADGWPGALPDGATRLAAGLDQLLDRLAVRHELLTGHLARMAGKGRAARTGAERERQALEQAGYLGERSGGPVPVPGLPSPLFR